MCLNNSVIIPQCQKNKNCHTAAHELDKFMCNRVAALTMHARTHAMKRPPVARYNKHVIIAVVAKPDAPETNHPLKRLATCGSANKSFWNIMKAASSA